LSTPKFPLGALSPGSALNTLLLLKGLPLKTLALPLPLKLLAALALLFRLLKAAKPLLPLLPVAKPLPLALKSSAGKWMIWLKACHFL
jgi:hypothetical protein